MRILHVVQRYWPYTGGAERHLQEISERLVRAGHSVTVLTTDALELELFWARGKARVDASVETHNGVLIRRFPVFHLPWPRWSFPGVRYGMTLLSGLPFDTSPALRRLSRLAPRVPGLVRELAETSERYDVVNGMNICFEGLLYAAHDYARRMGAAFVLTPLTHLGEGEGDRVRRYYTMRHQIGLSAAADAVLAQNQMEIDFLAAQGVPRAKLVHAGVGVNPDEALRGNPERFRAKYGIAGPFVFYAGAAAYDKGTFHLVEAMRQLWSEGETADLVIAGQVMDGFRALYDRLSPSEQAKCHVLGFIPEEDKRDLFAAGTVFAMPSRTDSIGIVYLEAWLNRKPVIGALAGGVPEVIDDGIDGYLVGFGDVAALAERIALLLRSPGLAAALGSRGRLKVLERYTWDTVYPRVEGVYNRLWLARNRQAGLPEAAGIRAE